MSATKKRLWGQIWKKTPTCPEENHWKRKENHSLMDWSCSEASRRIPVWVVGGWKAACCSVILAQRKTRLKRWRGLGMEAEQGNRQLNIHVPSPWSFCTSCSWGSWRSGWLSSRSSPQCRSAEGPAPPQIYCQTHTHILSSRSCIPKAYLLTHSKRCFSQHCKAVKASGTIFSHGVCAELNWPVR